ncbi:hypothetical protein BB560_003489 [Smittium megazygosporum]|uniref:Uncharacterized protein n=1 Tax=Smittium megazygosporum TaxID=133381 RepID=A0A2T9ZBW5_9FUNG|nr:hypothetical protein BB560_003489 [Smittium megazygosporum]
MFQCNAQVRNLSDSSRKTDFVEAASEITDETEYNQVVAIASLNSIVIYAIPSNENQSSKYLPTKAIAYAGDLHYGSITDFSWSPDGTFIVVVSTDGFASVIWFDSELGESKFFEKSNRMETHVQGKKVNAYIDLSNSKKVSDIIIQNKDQIEVHSPKIKKRRIVPTLISE